MEYSGRGAVAESLARSGIEFECDPIEVFLAVVGHADTFGKVLSRY